MTEKYLGAHSAIQHQQTSLAINVVKELTTGACIIKRVNRLASNEIEIGMSIPTINSRASNIPKDKGNDVRDFCESLTQRFNR